MPPWEAPNVAHQLTLDHIVLRYSSRPARCAAGIAGRATSWCRPRPPEVCCRRCLPRSRRRSASWHDGTFWPLLERIRSKPWGFNDCINEGSHIDHRPSASDIVHAKSLGLTWLKAFPASYLGLAWVKAMLGPFPDINFVATGRHDTGQRRGVDERRRSSCRPQLCLRVNPRHPTRSKSHQNSNAGRGLEI
jgi:hypothetical protein